MSKFKISGNIEIDNGEIQINGVKPVLESRISNGNGDIINPRYIKTRNAAFSPAGTFIVTPTGGSGVGAVLKITTIPNPLINTIGSIVSNIEIINGGSGYKVNDLLFIDKIEGTPLFKGIILTLSKGSVNEISDIEIDSKGSSIFLKKEIAGNKGILSPFSLINLDTLDPTPQVIGGVYNITPSTDGDGVGAEIEVTISSRGISTLSITNIINSGENYNIGDKLIISSNDLGGTDSINIEIELTSENVNISTASSIELDGISTIINSNNIILKNFPTEDPQNLGQLWVDTENNNVLKVSLGVI
jgi:hypothetical protein